MQGKSSPDIPILMEKLSREYGWTPDEIRIMSRQDVDDYLNIISLRQMIAEAEAKKNGKHR